jgi:hypothetical protein
VGSAAASKQRLLMGKKDAHESVTGSWEKM